jgi:cleavage and polyadenylation specificity factor subunit 1
MRWIHIALNKYPDLVIRIVRNDFVSKPLSKGILDGNLLAQYEALPITRQNEMTREIGTERLTVLRDWISLTGPW